MNRCRPLLRHRRVVFHLEFPISLSITLLLLYVRSDLVLQTTYAMHKIATTIGIPIDLPTNGYAAKQKTNATPANTLPIIDRMSFTPAAVPRIYVAIPS